MQTASAQLFSPLGSGLQSSPLWAPPHPAPLDFSSLLAPSRQQWNHWWNQHPSLGSHHLPQEPRLLGGFLEAGLTWRGRDEVKTPGLASGARLGIGSRLLSASGWGTSSAQAPRGGPGLGAGDWVLGQALSVLPQPLLLSWGVSSPLTSTILPALWGWGQTLWGDAQEKTSPKPGRSKGVKVLLAGDLLRVPHRHPTIRRTGSELRDVSGTERVLAG